MPLFKIAQGPWTLLLKGTLQDQELEVYTNPQKMIYVQQLREENGAINGLFGGGHTRFKGPNCLLTYG